MSLLSLTNLINSKIRNKSPKVLKAEHADVEQAIVNELCETGFMDNKTLGLVIDESLIPLEVDYEIHFKKIGKTVFVSGTYSKENGFYQGFLPIKNPAFFPKPLPLAELLNLTNWQGEVVAYNSNNVNAIVIFIENVAAPYVNFNGTYTTEN